MDPLLLASMGLGLGEAIFGAKQRADASSLKPSTYIPPSEIKNRTSAEVQANATMYPGQSADKAAIDRNTANTLGYLRRNSKSSADILNAGGAALTQGNNAVNEMSKRFAQFKNDSLNRLMNVNSRIAGYENQNEQQYLGTKRSLIDAGNKNIFGGLSNAGTALALGISKDKTGVPNFGPPNRYGSPFFSGSYDYNLPMSPTEMAA